MSDTNTIDAADAYEIAEALEWLRDWFDSDPGLARSMRCFSLGLVTLNEISMELKRFACTLERRS